MKGIRILIISFLCSGFIDWLQAAVSLVHIFDNNMVLQRDKPVKMWGLADPLEKVNIKFNGQSKSSVANKLGEWSLYLDPMIANTNPMDLIVSGKKNVLKFSNVLIGDCLLYTSRCV